MWHLYRFLLFICLSFTVLHAEPITFVENRGQWANEVRFRADIPGGYLYLKANALHYVFYDGDALSSHHTPKAGEAVSSTCS